MLSHLVRDLWLLNKLRSLKRPYFWYWYLEQINTAVKLKLLANKSTRYFKVAQIQQTQKSSVNESPVYAIIIEPICQ